MVYLKNTYLAVLFVTVIGIAIPSAVTGKLGFLSMAQVYLSDGNTI